MKKKNNPLIFIIIGCMAAAVSCNRENKEKAVTFASKVRQEQVAEPPIQGVYSVVLKSINQDGTGNNATGLGTIRVKNDEMRVNVNMAGVAATAHRQGIYVGNSCPDDAEDESGDGIVDADESEMAHGDLFIALDNNLTTPASAADTYIYSDHFSVMSLMDQLGEDLSLEGKVLVIHRVNGDQHLPIACGVIAKINEQDDPGIAGSH